MQNLHKDNAKFTMCAWVYTPSLGTNIGYFGDRGSFTAGNQGIAFAKRNDDKLIGAVSVGTTNVMILGHTVLMTVGWSFVAWGVDEPVGANGAFLQLNGTAEQYSSTYTTPPSTNATFTMQIGARGNADAITPSGGRMAAMCVWEGTKLTTQNTIDIFNLTRARFGV
jgi:hypothetical protein